MSHHLITYAMDYNMFRSFYEKFLNSAWLMKDDYIHLPKTDEEINHVERLYHRIGFPGAIGSVDCVHLTWNSCRHTLQMQCINAGAGESKGKPSVVFQCVVSHTTKCLSISDMFWGATSDATIVKFDKSIKEVTTGVYSTRQFTMYVDDGKKVNDIGLYYICDGGYPKFKHLIPLYKWTQVGTKKNRWSSAVESARKDVERFFGILKKRWRCLINPVDLQDPLKNRKNVWGLLYLTQHTS
jgi:hypothetical protein